KVSSPERLPIQIPTHDVEADVVLVAEVDPHLEGAGSTGRTGRANDGPFGVDASQLASTAQDPESGFIQHHAGRRTRSSAHDLDHGAAGPAGNRESLERIDNAEAVVSLPLAIVREPVAHGLAGSMHDAGSLYRAGVSDDAGPRLMGDVRGVVAV